MRIVSLSSVDRIHERLPNLVKAEMGIALHFLQNKTAFLFVEASIALKIDIFMMNELVDVSFLSVGGTE